MNVNSILCVCTGNICRSPYAEGLLRRDLPGLRVSSAGVHAAVGAGMPDRAASIARRKGLDLQRHRGRQVSLDIVRENEVVLVMESGHRRWLADHFPETRGRVFLASHWCGNEDVPDPIGCSEQVYTDVFALLDTYMQAWASRLMA